MNATDDMADLTQLRALGDHLDHEPPATLARQRNRLLDVAAGPRKSRRPRRVPILAGGITTAAAVAGACALLIGTGTPAPRPLTARTDAAVKVLNRAAQVTAAQQTLTTDPRQWIYYETAEYGAQTAEGMHPRISNEWIQFDGRQSAGIENGKLRIYPERTAGPRDPGTPRGAYDVLRALPTNPAALRSALRKAVGGQPSGAATPNGQLFDNIVQLISDSVIGAPPKTQAALYRLLATFPGVRVNPGTRDGLGRHDIGITDGPGAATLLLDPATYQVLGFQVAWDGKATPAEITMAQHKKEDAELLKLPAGTITYGLIHASVTPVDHPGQR